MLQRCTWIQSETYADKDKGCYNLRTRLLRVHVSYELQSARIYSLQSVRGILGIRLCADLLRNIYLQPQQMPVLTSVSSLTLYRKLTLKAEPAAIAVRGHILKVYILALKKSTLF